MKTKSFLLFTFLVIQGSFCLGQWTKVPGTTGEYFSSFTLCNGQIYTGGYYYGFFSVDNQGNSIQGIDSSVGMFNVIATVDSFLIAGSTYSGIIKSTDQGQTWNGINNGFNLQSDVRALLVFGDNILAGSEQQTIQKSTDKGQTWTSPPGVNLSSIRYFCESPAGVFSAKPTEVFFSPDSGATWTSRSTGLPNQGIGNLLSIDTTLFVSTDSGVFFSSDYGISWTLRNNGIGTPPNLGTIELAGQDIYVGYIGVAFKSTDMGLNWTSVSQGLSGYAIKELYFHNGILFAAMVFDGIYKLGGLPSSLNQNLEGPSRTYAYPRALEKAKGEIQIFGFPQGRTEVEWLSSEGKLLNKSVSEFEDKAIIYLPDQIFPGIYFLRIRNESGEMIEKILVLD